MALARMTDDWRPILLIVDRRLSAQAFVVFDPSFMPVIRLHEGGLEIMLLKHYPKTEGRGVPVSGTPHLPKAA